MISVSPTNLLALGSSSNVSNLQTLFDYVVDPGNSSCFNSIQAALDVAYPNASIFISDGVYHEPIIVSKPVTLIGQSKESTYLECCSAENGYALSITSPDVVIKNLRISNHAPGLYTTAIKCGAPRCRIQDCILQDTPIGLAIWCSDIVVQGCRFIGCADEGIAVLGSSNHPCTSLMIMDCEFRDNCDGIEIQHGSDIVISSCVFSGNTHAGVDIITQNNHDIDIVDSTFFAHPGYGLFISQTCDMNIRNCSFSDSIIEVKHALKTWVSSCTNPVIQADPGSSVIISRFSDIRSFIRSTIGAKNSRHPFRETLLKFLDTSYRVV